jgi:Mg-chelatase subunit ChlD
MATLRACAPWQTLRQPIGEPRKLRIQPSDIRVTRFKQPQETATIFVVDASGSSALHRMAEAKGAIELLLTDCYSRRDSVALIAFKGTEAEVLLPPTRSLVAVPHWLTPSSWQSNWPRRFSARASHLPPFSSPTAWPISRGMARLDDLRPRQMY